MHFNESILEGQFVRSSGQLPPVRLLLLHVQKLSLKIPWNNWDNGFVELIVRAPRDRGEGHYARARARAALCALRAARCALRAAPDARRPTPDARRPTPIPTLTFVRPTRSARWRECCGERTP